MSCAGSRTYRALEVWVYFLDDMHPKATAPLHTALLQEQYQPVHKQDSTCGEEHVLTLPVSDQKGEARFHCAPAAHDCSHL